MEIEVFQYQASGELDPPSWEPWTPVDLATDGASENTHADAGSQQTDGMLHEVCAQQILAEARRSFEAGHEKGIAEGRLKEREVQATGIEAREKQRVLQVMQWIEAFGQERDRYFEAVEAEVVRLSVAVAARILRREAQMDPLLLTGAVRVALRQVSATTEVRLLVPSEDLDLWKEALEHLPNLAVKPTVVAGEAMKLGDCIIETALGSANLGLREQLAEIERGFFDRVGTKVAGGCVSHTKESRD